MPFNFWRFSQAFIAIAGIAAPAIGQDGEARFTASDIEAAIYQGGDLPPGRSALTAKIQLLLDRSGTSPGVIDGYKGGMSESALKAFERRAGLPIDGKMDPQVWQMLLPHAATSQTMDYQITQEDAEGLVDEIPADYAKKAAMSAMAYTSIAEKLGERFHMDEKFIAFLNPGISLTPGATIRVMSPGKPIKTKVTRIIVDKSTRRVAAYDSAGQMIVDYPATVGSDVTPSPSGNHVVVTVALNPNYTYNPEKNFKQGDNDKPLLIPPGPNGPVGNVWIDLTKPTYGIHGTPTPSRLFHNQSNGCVRLTNWDARELSGMVVPGKTTVEFLEPGITIADVTGSQPAAGSGEVPTETVTTPALDAAMVAQEAQANSPVVLSATRPPRRGGATPAVTQPTATSVTTTATSTAMTTATTSATAPAGATAPVATTPGAVPMPGMTPATAPVDPAVAQTATSVKDVASDPATTQFPAALPAQTVQPIYEDTSEEPADGLGEEAPFDPTSDALSNALNNAISESGFVVPAPAEPQ